MMRRQALADIIQEKVNGEFGDAKDIPQLTNASVFCYLVCATAFNRRWKQFYVVVLKDSSFHFFDDKKDAGQINEALNLLSSRGSKTEVADDYHKRKNVFRLRMENGNEYLFQAKDVNDIAQWIQYLRECSTNDGQEMPKKEKKRSLFKRKR